MLVVGGTLPMIFKVGSKAKCDLSQIGHTSILLHLSRLKEVKFLYDFINAGLSCLSMLTEPLVPNSFTMVLEMAFVLWVRNKNTGTGRFNNNTGAFAICCIDINPVWFLSKTCMEYCNGTDTA